ncbi:hypothetical protein CGQ24_08160 [Arthrobacter sp. 7749]|nr:hypothetical protein CGQ24_08160 [Arthrobacter sp. 7749]
MRTWQEFMVQRINGSELGVPWYLHDKLKCYRFCEENNIATATVVREFDTPDQIDLNGIEGEFVLKPTLQSSMKGVMVLEAADGGFYDSLRRRTLTIEEIIDEQTKMFEETLAAGKKVIIERKIEDIDGHGIPRDFKAYTFRGEIALILEINRNTSPSSISWFDGNFEPLTDDRVTSNPKYVNEIPAVPPASASALLELARQASAIVPSPFSSIDMYSTADGPMVGEVTLAPGGLYHGQHYTLSGDQQKRMGIMWQRALDSMTPPAKHAHLETLSTGDRTVRPFELEPLLEKIQDVLALTGLLTSGDYRRALADARGSNTWNDASDAELADVSMWRCECGEAVGANGDPDWRHCEQAKS